MATETLRDTLNASDPNRVNSGLQIIGLGELMTLLVKGLTPTESGATITSHVCTMAAQPAKVFQVKGIGGTAGVKTLLKGQITGTGAITPNPGEVVWDGGVKLLFNVADANTTCDLTYTKADGTDLASCLMASMGG